MYGAPCMRSFVTSVSGPRSSPDPVRFCAQCACSSTRRVSDSATFCDPRSLRLLLTPSPADVALMQSFPLSTAATAISSIANPRRQPAVNHDPRPAVAGRALSTRHKGLILGSCEASQASEASILVIGHRQPVSPHQPPTSTALIGSLGGLLC
jgi:hypothetical protein